MSDCVRRGWGPLCVGTADTGMAMAMSRSMRAHSLPAQLFCALVSVLSSLPCGPKSGFHDQGLLGTAKGRICFQNRHFSCNAIWEGGGRGGGRGRGGREEEGGGREQIQTKIQHTQQAGEMCKGCYRLANFKMLKESSFLMQHIIIMWANIFRGGERTDLLGTDSWAKPNKSGLVWK